MFGLGDMLQQAAKVREEAKKIQENLAQKTVEVSSGGGMVKVTANGRAQILSVWLDPEVLKLNDKNMLEDLIRAGVNSALQEAAKLAQAEMEKLTAGLGPIASLFKNS